VAVGIFAAPLRDVGGGRIRPEDEKKGTEVRRHARAG